MIQGPAPTNRPTDAFRVLRGVWKTALNLHLALVALWHYSLIGTFLALFWHFWPLVAPSYRIHCFTAVAFNRSLSWRGAPRGQVVGGPATVLPGPHPHSPILEFELTPTGKCITAA
ncbi:hypothetical protein BDW67DRAFT_23547 [Aspergillus spinulosporus]